MKHALAIIAILALGYQIFGPREMFMKAPTDAAGLSMYGIESTQLEKVNEKWVRREFNIEDTSISHAIFESIKSYTGNCPCPYILYSNLKRRCGGNSAYSLSGGKITVCYPIDVINIRGQTLHRENIDSTFFAQSH